MTEGLTTYLDSNRLTPTYKFRANLLGVVILRLSYQSLKYSYFDPQQSLTRVQTRKTQWSSDPNCTQLKRSWVRNTFTGVTQVLTQRPVDNFTSTLQFPANMHRTGDGFVVICNIRTSSTDVTLILSTLSSSVFQLAHFQTQNKCT